MGKEPYINNADGLEDRGAHSALATGAHGVGAAYLAKVKSSQKYAFSAEGAQALINLLGNGDFEVGDPPTAWTLAGAGATLSRSSAQVKIGDYSALLTRVGANADLTQIIPDYARYKGRQVTAGAWVYATVADRARLLIWDAAAETYSAYHTGVAGWEWLTVTHAVNAAATDLQLKCVIQTGNTSAYFDGAILVEGDSCPAFSPKPDEALICHHTAAHTISPYETGHVVHTNLGAGAAILFTLPQIAWLIIRPGLVCRFSVMAAFELRITPGAAGAIYINGAKQVDNKYISADDEAESVDLVADGNGDWIARNAVGTWGVEV